METIISLVERGGFAMYPLLLLSVVSWTIIVERAFSIRRSLYIPRPLDQIKSLIAAKDIDGAMKVLALYNTQGNKIISKILDYYSKGHKKEEILKEIDMELSLVLYKLEKNLPILSTVASISPLLGLFGTITGLIKVFSAFSVTELDQGMSLLSKGISEALVAAATGLAVAIPALFAYWLFKVLAVNTLNKLEEEVVEIMRLLR